MKFQDLPVEVQAVAAETLQTLITGKTNWRVEMEEKEFKHVIALLLEDAKRLQELEPNAGTEARIWIAKTVLTKPLLLQNVFIENPEITVKPADSYVDHGKFTGVLTASRWPECPQSLKRCVQVPDDCRCCPYSSPCCSSARSTHHRADSTESGK